MERTLQTKFLTLALAEPIFRALANEGRLLHVLVRTLAILMERTLLAKVLILDLMKSLLRALVSGRQLKYALGLTTRLMERKPQTKRTKGLELGMKTGMKTGGTKFVTYCMTELGMLGLPTSVFQVLAKLMMKIG